MTEVTGSPAPLLGTLYDDIDRYYTRKIERHGPTPLGVDWSCVPTQEMRFVQLLKVCQFHSPFTLNDIGCGYGALLAYLSRRHRSKIIDYVGIDLSAAMIAHARRLWQRRARTQFLVSNTSPRVADYSIASGIFNVRLQQPLILWTEFIATVLADMHANSRYGFAVNFLSPVPATATNIPELYRVAPEVWQAHCERVLGAKVEVVCGYGMKEFTLLVQNSALTSED